MLWLWIPLIIVGAVLICLFVFLYDKRKSIFKIFSKQERKAKKEKRSLKKSSKLQKDIKHVEHKDEVIFEEKNIEVVNNESLQVEEYLPSDQFVENDVMPYIPKFNRRRPERRDISHYESLRRKYGYENKKSIKEQIDSLSPEMKAILFGNVLDRKDDEF